MLSTASIFRICFGLRCGSPSFVSPPVGELGVVADVEELPCPRSSPSAQRLVRHARVEHRDQVVHLAVEHAAVAAAADHAAVHVLVDGGLGHQRGQRVDRRRDEVGVGVLGRVAHHGRAARADRHHQQVALAASPSRAGRPARPPSGRAGRPGCCRESCRRPRTRTTSTRSSGSHSITSGGKNTGAAVLARTSFQSGILRLQSGALGVVVLGERVGADRPGRVGGRVARDHREQAARGARGSGRCPRRRCP